MADVHQLITLHGVEEARRQAVTQRERQAVETAYKVLSDDVEAMGFAHSGFAITSLPHRTTAETFWRRRGHNLTLHIESGRNDAGSFIGIPYGSYARFILLFLQTEAVRTKSRDIELGRSMHVWLGSMGLSVGGATYQAVKEQAKRISYCRLTFFRPNAAGEDHEKGAFVERAITMSDTAGGRQGMLWTDRVLLNDSFYRQLCEHPVPVNEAALRAIGPRSMVLDIYIWLAYRLHSLSANVPVTWAALVDQFGFSYARTRRFKEHFIECLVLALAAYPDARVSIVDKGIVLHPSPPAVTKS